MLLPVTAAILAVFASIAACSNTTPGPPPYPTVHTVATKPIALKTVITPGGPLVYYGLASNANTTDASPAANTTAGAQKRCGTNYVVCKGDHVPNASTCLALINGGLHEDARTVPTNAYAICLESASQCCISWSRPVPGLQARWLYNGAADAYRGCVAHGQSGASCDTNLNGVCLLECLTDRPEGCD